MTNETDNPIANLATLSSQLLGVVAILVQEIVRTQAVDVERLRKNMDGFLESELNEPNVTDAERRMISSVKKVLDASFVRGSANE